MHSTLVSSQHFADALVCVVSRTRVDGYLTEIADDLPTLAGPAGTVRPAAALDDLARWVAAGGGWQVLSVRPPARASLATVPGCSPATGSASSSDGTKDSLVSVEASRP